MPLRAMAAGILVAGLAIGGALMLRKGEPEPSPPPGSDDWTAVAPTEPLPVPLESVYPPEKKPRPDHTAPAGPSPFPTADDLTGERAEVADIVPDENDPAKEGKPRSFVAGRTKNRLNPGTEVRIHWDEIPGTLAKASIPAPNDVRNTRRSDYVGAEACRDCHTENHDDWLRHSHRLMNAKASDETVRGDFSGAAMLDYLGGRALLHQQDGQRRISLERDGVKRAYTVTRTLGSRFFQYYIGRLIEGPEPEDHISRKDEQLLPVGWWIDKKQIVPIVHVHGELPDKERYDPFDSPTNVNYDRQCAICHVTYSAGDWIMQAGGSLRMQMFSPRDINFHASRYLAETHPNLVPPDRSFQDYGIREITELLRDKVNTEINVKSAVNLGISCEACHFGCAQHAKDESIKPPFFLADPQLVLTGESPGDIWAKSSQNKNWLCSRCHSGGRPEYANGADTWNSTEYSDAVSGFCYDIDKAHASGMEQLTCVHCHDPHKGIGKKWPLTPKQDDAKCLACHKQFEKETALLSHTRHSSDSAGSRCMNCHMPRITEGLQDMIRSHKISSPTDPRMIESNQPNACNLCHLDQPIDWTIARLREWHGDKHVYDDNKLNESHKERAAPTGINYLLSPHEAVRLAGSQAMFEQKAAWAMPGLVRMLNDPYLINRQFTQKSFLEEFGLDLTQMGYRFTMTEEERKTPIARIRQALMQQATVSQPSPAPSQK